MLQASCVPVCDFRAACGKNAVCRPGANHRSICSCPTGYAGNSLISCEPLPRCVVHSDCADGQKCHAGRCTSAPARCVSDSECSDFEVCLTGQCKFGCRTSGQCAYDESCVNNVCLNACELTLCTLNARCLSIAHQPQCICLPGYEGDGRHSCLPKRVFCQSNAHCSSGQICVGNVCVSGCGNDSHCNHDQRCESGRCSALCTEKTCGFGGYCESSNHSSSCKCPAGWEGDPYIHCTQRNQTTIDLPSIIQTNISTSTEATSVSLPPTDVSEPSIVDCRDDAQCNVGSICEGNHCRAGCRLDAHCTYDSACVHGRCKLVCSLDSVCGRNGMCQPLMHRARCHCPPGTSGDPYDYCESFSIDPTRPPTFVPDPSNATKNISTGRHQQCTSQVHCLSGSFCSSDGHCIAGCESDHHCPANLACIRRTCSDPCASACATNAQCNLSANRQPICSCLPGFTGDASRQCTALRLSVCQSDLDCGIAQICEQKRCVEACRTDDTCSTGNSCINRRCQNPCAVYGVCGPSTTCLARDHQPHCECLHGFAGNPQIGCEPLIIPTQPSRNRTDDIPLDQKVPMVPTRPDVSSRTQLATNRTDRPVLSTVICSSDEACGFGRICRDAICVTGCRFHHQCAPHKQCHGGQCKNPCNENSCAVNAFCVASNHQAHCTCRPGFVGDGRRECRPFVAAGRSCAHARQCGGHALCSNGACRSGCTDDDQCNPEQACIHGTCQSPCAVANVCGRKALCTERNHTAVCECPDGYRGNANRLCTRAPPECTVDDECRIGQVCESSQCVSGCRGDHNCPVDQACLAGGKCGDPCRQSNACGSNSRCIVHRHRVRCECQPGFVGDPFASCVLPATDICENDLQCGLGQVCTRNRCVVGCTNDAGCRFEHSCINGQCRNPCEIFGACGVNAICTPQEHDRVCSCPPDWSGDARLMCEPFITPSSCRSDHECPTGHLCYVSHLNLESNMTASTWATGRCVLGCHNSNSCPPDRHCRNGLCEDPCSASGICGRHAICSVIEHEPVCSCPAGMRGQQNRGGACVDATISVGDRNECDQDIDCGLERICLRGVCASGCRTHRGCSLDKACVNGECQSPCTLGGMCGVNSICRSVGHQAQCTCAPGYTGDPLKQCSRAHVQCETASDCGRGHVCVKGQCKDINECLQERLPCGPGASCTNEPGWYRCQCPPPLVGNPYDLNTGCRQPKPLCLIDKDCQSNQKCNPVTKECYGSYFAFNFF